MTDRKPPGVSWQSWIDRQISEGQREGAFDDLEGHGEPIDGLGTVHDDLWWVKAKLREEDIDYLPPTIAIRADRADALDAAMGAATEEEARALVDAVNERIRYVNSHAAAGPPSSVMTIDVDAFVDRWRAAHPHGPPSSDQPASAGGPTEAPTARTRRRRWWQRVFSRSQRRVRRSSASVR